MERFDGERSTGNRVVRRLTKELGELQQDGLMHASSGELDESYLFGIHGGRRHDEFEVSSSGQDCRTASVLWFGI